MTDSTIPLSPEQVRALHKLAARWRLDVPVVIAIAIRGLLAREAAVGQPVQMRLPLPGELRRLAAEADHAVARFRSAARKVNPPRLVAPEPTRVM